MSYLFICLIIVCGIFVERKGRGSDRYEDVVFFLENLKFK